MEWLLILVFGIFIGGIGIVTMEAIKHAEKSSLKGKE